MKTRCDCNVCESIRLQWISPVTLHLPGVHLVKEDEDHRDPRVVAAQEAQRRDEQRELLL